MKLSSWNENRMICDKCNRETGRLVSSMCIECFDKRVDYIKRILE